ncbi:MAG: NADH:ubiquinone reductase (Na(+)-transporting) subunit A [Flavobacteriales bacterium CG_4_9_14_3_um_filter_40_17]|nr:MAG: NADH:ubiquinone reductase (Na(+)-transporting) subunit A [Flavobacteriales bacterium CG_4_9_14_3_um_filter_40_17]
MSTDIRIKKGISIKLKGEANKVIKDAPRSQIYSIHPSDLPGIVPKLLVKEGAKVQAGDPIFYSKTNDQLQVVSPVSGTIGEIVRGEKRRILEIQIQADSKEVYKDFSRKDPNNLTSDEIKKHLLASGCWPFIKQRPYDIVANPADEPRDIFISAYASAPLSTDVEFALKDREKDFQAGVDALAKITAGKVHLGIEKNSTSYFSQIKNVDIHKISGPHPAGNVGILIHHVKPINAGEKIWVIAPQDVALIGKLFSTGQFDAGRVIALSGTGIKEPQYYKITQGANLSNFLKDKLEGDNNRIINGDVLTGIKITAQGDLGFYQDCLTVIPEGNKYRLFGWLPFVDNNIPSLSKTSFSWLRKNKPQAVDTNLNGEERAFVVTGEMEKVFPMDIYPMQLLKACLANDIEKMENLGIYEVAPEDFAVIDFANTSKIEAQDIIRQGLDLMIKEVG